MYLTIISFIRRCLFSAEIRAYRYLRRKKLKNTAGANLENGYLDSFELLEIVKAEINRDDIVIYDIGGHIGTWAVLAKSIFPSAEVHVFEPLPDHLSELNKNAGHLSGVTIHNMALGSKSETAVMNIATNSDSSSLLDLTDNMYNEYGQVKVSEKKVQVLTLNDFIKQKGVAIPDLIKMDVQGFELEVLKGASEILSKVKYLILEVSFVEFYAGQPLVEEIISNMFGNGFRFYAFGKNTAVGKRIIQTDVLFKAGINGK
jgi:FkbM family methyltransferase